MPNNDKQTSAQDSTKAQAKSLTAGSSDNVPTVEAFVSYPSRNWKELRGIPGPSGPIPNEDDFADEHEDGASISGVKRVDDGAAEDASSKVKAASEGVVQAVWKECQRNDGTTYYFNEVTKESTFLDPGKKVEPPEGSMSE